jgi:hypothetical protein
LRQDKGKTRRRPGEGTRDVKIASACLLLALPLLAGCTGLPVVSRNLATPPPTAEEMRELTGGQITQVVVASSPFATVPPYRLSALVASQMPQLNQARYALVPTMPIPVPYVLLWQFGSRPHGDRTDVTASLAFLTPGLPPLSEVHGHVEAVAGPEDPAFHRFIEQMTFGVLWPDQDFSGSGGALQLFFP